MEIQALGGGEQLDADGAGGVARDPPRLEAPVGGHRDMVFLSGGSRDRVDARRESEALILRNERGRSHLSDHEAGIDAAILDQEGRQAAHLGIDQNRQPALGDGADFAQGDRHDVGRKGDRLGVEVSPGQGVVAEQQGIVAHGIGFDLKGPRDIAKQIEDGAHHLRLAAETIGVLDAVALRMGLADFTTRQEAPEAFCDSDLARLPPGFVDPRVERDVGALERIERQCAADQGGAEHPFCGEQYVERDRGRRLGAVDQGEPFFRAQDERFEAEPAQGVSGGQSFPVEVDFAFTDQGRTHVGERREVARGTDRALAGDDRKRVRGHQSEKMIDQLAADTTMASTETDRIQYHHQTDDALIERLA